MKKSSVALIVSTYNRPDALKACLHSITHQTFMPDEVIIADDGSTADTQETISAFKKETRLNIIHVWQEDMGFRLAAIRNKAISVSSSEYIVQIDGDIVLHKNFIEDHVKQAKQNHFISGKRHNLDKETTLRVIKSATSTTALQKAVKSSLSLYSIRFNPLTALMKLFQRKNNGFLYVLGSNMSFWRSDLLCVNGYNEDFIGWGKEDNELSLRLMNAGAQPLFIKFNCIQYHLYHDESGRINFHQNEHLFKDTLANNTTFIRNGISKEQLAFFQTP